MPAEEDKNKIKQNIAMQRSWEPFQNAPFSAKIMEGTHCLKVQYQSLLQQGWFRLQFTLKSKDMFSDANRKARDASSFENALGVFLKNDSNENTTVKINIWANCYTLKSWEKIHTK